MCRRFILPPTRLSTSNHMNFKNFPAKYLYLLNSSDSSDKLCVPQTLSALEGILDVEDLAWNTFWETLSKLADYKNVACTKGAYNIGSKVFPFPDLLTQASKPISDTCDASFLGKWQMNIVIFRCAEYTQYYVDADSPDISHTAVSGEFLARKPSALSGFGSVSLMGATLFVILSLFIVTI